MARGSSTPLWDAAAGLGLPLNFSTRQCYTGINVPLLWDEIVMPSKERFSSATNAYAVALHEATHSTGHASRLNREFGKRFGDDAYAFEELVAEPGSAFLVAHLGLAGARMENHVCYIEAWLRVLRSGSSAVFAASRHASAAFQFLVGAAEPSTPQQAEQLAA